MAGIKFGRWAANQHCKNIGRFKFGGFVRDHHTYICKYEILVGINLAIVKVDRQINSPPIFPAIRYPCNLAPYGFLINLDIKHGLEKCLS